MIAKLYLSITSDAGKESSYVVERVYPDDERIRLMWMLEKEESKEGEGPYTVSLDHTKVARCDCPHGKYSKAACKHLEAMRNRGLLPGGGQ